MEVSKDNWEEELKKLEDSTCVHWINKGFRVKETESSSLGRHKTILWSKKYVCHRGPDIYVSKAKTNDDNGRPVQKNSKKIGCNTIIMVTCRISDLSFVEVTRKNDHNHIPGSYSDLQHMSISDTLPDKTKNFLFVRHPDTGKGVPVGYLLTNDQSVTLALEWLKFFRDHCSMQPEQIAVDCSIPEADAIRVTFGENCRLQLCFFLVAQCWSRNLATKIKNQRGQYNNAKVIRSNIMSELQSIMYETVRENVIEKICQFREKWTSVQPNFVKYLENRWLALEGYKKWSAAYNRRLDRLVFIPTNDVESDLKLDVERICSEVGRMGPDLRRRRQREMVADSIPKDRMIEIISKDGDTQYTVESFNQENILYVVKINEDGKIASCSCSYFNFNSAVCKHMYLLKRHINVEVEVLSRMEILLSQAPIPVLADTSVNNDISDSVSSQDVERFI
ncbi:hypothetical protein G6F46_011501 [Rhizopus delemar]|nr:hypothetical protein G6F46_011501 [Rhizopus delemar]